MRHFQAAVAVCVLTGIAALAPANTMSWVFQSTGTGASPDLSLAMRDGYTWPVVFNGSTCITTLTPAGWQRLGFPGLSGPTRAASSPLGEVAATLLMPPAQGLIIGSTSVTPLSALAATYDRNGGLWTADQYGKVYQRTAGGWSPLPVMPIATYSSVSLAVAGDGQVAAAVDVGGAIWCMVYSPLTASWAKTPTALGGGEKPSIAFSSRDGLQNVPHIVAVQNTGGVNRVVAYDYDVRTGGWVNSPLAGSEAVSTYLVPLCGDDAGTVGAAWISQDRRLFYARNTDNSGWVSYVVPTGTGPGGIGAMAGAVGLAFDYKDQPVIAYAGADSKVWIAYDPVEIPEPVTLSLLSVGMVALLRRRRA